MEWERLLQTLFHLKTDPDFLKYRDAYDHVERFKQISRGCEPMSDATKVVAFALTLDDQVGIWFQTYWKIFDWLQLRHQELPDKFCLEREQMVPPLTNYSHSSKKGKKQSEITYAATKVCIVGLILVTRRSMIN